MQGFDPVPGLRRHPELIQRLMTAPADLDSYLGLLEPGRQFAPISEQNPTPAEMESIKAWYGYTYTHLSAEEWVMEKIKRSLHQDTVEGYIIRAFNTDTFKSGETEIPYLPDLQRFNKKHVRPEKIIRAALQLLYNPHSQTRAKGQSRAAHIQSMQAQHCMYEVLNDTGNEGTHSAFHHNPPSTVVELCPGRPLVHKFHTAFVNAVQANIDTVTNTVALQV